MIDYKKFVENSRKWLSHYISNNNLKSCVLGISGGIDSTVVAALAFPVCQELNIPLIGRSLPTGTNKKIECDVADLVGNTFCTDYKVVELDLPYVSITEKIAEYEGVVKSLQAGNIKARLRMIYLYHLASSHKGIVLDTDNRTEHELGFWTINGDIGDLNLGTSYLWKTEIYDLAEYLSRELLDEYCLDKNESNLDKYQAILNSINLIPTDGNGVSDSDCEQFGVDNYDQVDSVLKAMADPDFLVNHTEEINKIPFDGINKILDLHHKTEYKRKLFPITPTKQSLEIE